ncbi:LPS export ABC transporter periplasmic protein LptC [bacterium]|nr:LPS export ABC transporter periplasmic protein LptC [bacterium]
MRINLRAIECGGFFLSLCVSQLYADPQTEQAIPVGKVEDGVSIFDHDSSGKRIWELHGSSANFLDDGYIEIMDVTVVFYGNEVEDNPITLESPSAQVNQTEKKVRTDQPIKITANDIIVSGKGLDGNMENSCVQIRTNVIVVLHGKNKNMFFPDLETELDENQNKL